jgi:hypothetical protein
MEPMKSATESNSTIPTPLTSKPTSNEDVYVINGIEHARVTHVLHRTKSTDGLNAWYSIEERKKIGVFLEVSRTLEEARAKFRALDAHAAEEIRDEKADLGKQVHALMERYLTEKLLGAEKVHNVPRDLVITGEAVRRFNHFLTWEKAHRVELVPGYEPCEHTVHSEILRVAGTLDLHLLIDGKETILDLKTGKHIYRDGAIQDTIYALMELEGRARRAGNEESIMMFEQFYNTLDCPPIDWPGLSILHIPEEGCFEYQINPAEAESYVRCFLARLRAFRCDSESKPFRRVWPKEEKRWLRLK